MDPLEQKSKLAVLMELMKKADDAEATKLKPEDDSDPLASLGAHDLGTPKDEHSLGDSMSDAPASPGGEDMDPAELQKLMALYESLK